MSSEKSLRKAAILLSCLDEAEARAMLRQMTPAQRETLRTAERRLGRVAEQEQLAVMEEFFRIGPIRDVPTDTGIELDGNLARELEWPAPQSGSAQTKPAYSQAESRPAVPMRTLHSARGRDLAAAVAAEHPQTIAAMVSHLRPEQAAELLAELPGTLQADVARRLVNLEELHPDVLADIERGIESFLAANRSFQHSRTAGIAALDSILARADQATRNKILSNLDSHDRQLARQIRTSTGNGEPRRVTAGLVLTFSRLMSLDDDALTKVLHAVETEVMVLALVGASEELVARVLRQLPFEESRTLRYALEHLGPTRLSDLEEAQQRVAEHAQHLLDSGEIEPTGRRAISLAV
jgi:flagellar motor switch protein FliG